MAEAFVLVALALVIAAYYLGMKYLEARTESLLHPELHEDVEEIKSKLSAMALRDGFKLK